MDESQLTPSQRVRLQLARSQAQAAQIKSDEADAFEKAIKPVWYQGGNSVKQLGQEAIANAEVLTNRQYEIGSPMAPRPTDGGRLRIDNKSVLEADRQAIGEDTPVPPPISGCTDPSATNYNPAATIDDGSCAYPVYGCTDPSAANYNPAATIDDGSCVYGVLGCTDPTANNYNPDATINDGSCTYTIPGLSAGWYIKQTTGAQPNKSFGDAGCWDQPELIAYFSCGEFDPIPPNGTGSYGICDTLDDGSYTITYSKIRVV